MHRAHLQLSRHLHLGCPEPRAPSGLLAIASAEGSRSELDTLRGRGGSDPARFLMCLDQLPDPARNQPLTSCKKPHRTEILPEFLQLRTTRYPSAATLSSKGRSGCATVVARRKDLHNLDLVITASWKSPTEWTVGTLEGHCWIHRKAGLLPAIERGSPSARWDGQPLRMTL